MAKPIHMMVRVLQEARAMARLRHASVVSVYEVGRHDAWVFIAMEHLDGPSLRDKKYTRQLLILTIKCGRPNTQMPAFDKFAYSDGRCYMMTAADLAKNPTRMPDPPAPVPTPSTPYYFLAESSPYRSDGDRGLETLAAAALNPLALDPAPVGVPT